MLDFVACAGLKLIFFFFFFFENPECLAFPSADLFFKKNHGWDLDDNESFHELGSIAFSLLCNL